jgi:nucleoside-diphosphate-sugar epimerase
MRVVITGGTGFVGRKLAARLLKDGSLEGPGGGKQEISELVLFDNAEPNPALELSDKRLKVTTGDITDTAQVEALITPDTGSIWHLAAVVSAGAEADLDLGYAVNLDGTRHVVNACRKLKTPPRLMFASSAAVYGGEPPLSVDDLTPPSPRTSYGGQKAMGEIFVNDYTRRGILDGRSMRLPTIVVRPGRPNKAASTFASSIMREPLAGEKAICPVSPESKMAILSPRRLIETLITLHNLEGAKLGFNRTVLLPSISVSIGEMADSLRRIGGEEAAGRIVWQPDPFIQKIVDQWPGSMKAPRAEGLGLKADANMDEIVTAFVEDDLPAQKKLAAGGGNSTSVG